MTIRTKRSRPNGRDFFICLRDLFILYHHPKPIFTTKSGDYSPLFSFAFFRLKYIIAIIINSIGKPVKENKIIKRLRLPQVSEKGGSNSMEILIITYNISVIMLYILPNPIVF